MADITITIPPAQEDRVRAMVAARLEQDFASTTLADAKQFIIDQLVLAVKVYEFREAEKAIAVSPVTPT